MVRLFLLIALSTNFFASCDHQVAHEYNINKKSPDGSYEVKINIREGPPLGTRKYTELGSFRFFKGQELIHSYDWTESDQYEPSFQQTSPVIEWVDRTVLRMGRDRKDQPFFDELTVANDTDEYIKYFTLSYGKYESFWVFDIAPRSQTKLNASPGLSGGSANYFAGYGGASKNGKTFEGVAEAKQRKSVAEGPLKFQITIHPTDLK